MYRELTYAVKIKYLYDISIQGSLGKVKLLSFPQTEHFMNDHCHL